MRHNRNEMNPKPLLEQRLALAFQEPSSAGYYDLPDEEEDRNPDLTVIAGLHGNELNGVLISQILLSYVADNVARLRSKVRLIPLVNPTAFVLGRRNWPLEGEDIYAMFGWVERPSEAHTARGALPQQIAAAVLDKTSDSRFVVDIHSGTAYMRQYPQLHYYVSHRATDKRRCSYKQYAAAFGLSCVWQKTIVGPADVSEPTFLRPPTSLTARLASDFDKQGTDQYAFLMTCGNASEIDAHYCKLVLQALERFMMEVGIIAKEGLVPILEMAKTKAALGSEPVRELSPGTVLTLADSLVARVKTPVAGIFVAHCDTGQQVSKGERIGSVVSVESGEVEQLCSPVNGHVLSLAARGMVHADALVTCIRSGS